MQDCWSSAPVGTGPIDPLIHQSRLLGLEPSLVLGGGGNTSLKVVEPDFRGRPTDVLRIKGSGSELRTAKAADFPGVRMDDALATFAFEDMTDEEMVEYLGHCLMEPGARRPSIETLLHAFIPAASVAHTHADAILALANAVDAERLFGELYGGDVLLVPYRRPGFLLAKEVGVAVRARPNARGLVLLNHGLVTWGDSAEAAYRRHVELVTEVEDFLTRRGEGRRVFAAEPRHRLDEPTRRAAAARLGPLLRGALGRDKRVVLRHVATPELLDFVGSPRAREVSAAGAATPDHILATKVLPLWLDVDPAAGDDALARSVEQAVETYRRDYLAYVGRHRTDEPLLDANPRLVLVPGIGLFSAAPTARAADLAAAIYEHTVAIMAGAETVSRYRSLDEPEAFRAEYWPLELYKLTLAPPERELARRVALVTGAANGIGRAAALGLAAAGAHVVVTDRDEEGARQLADEIERSAERGAAVAARLDVTDEAEVESAFEAACLAYGGVDVVVSNAGVAHCAPLDQLALADWERSLAVNATGHFLVARAALRLLKRQRTGGALVFVATKNVVAPGRDFGAYSAAKAAEAQLARVAAIEGGPHGVRVNMVNPDAIFGDSRLWSPALREERARSYGIAPDQLEEHYRRRTLLDVNVTAADVAEAVVFLASGRAAKTTGAMLPVDGGVREAFPR